MLHMNFRIDITLFTHWANTITVNEVMARKQLWAIKLNLKVLKWNRFETPNLALSDVWMLAHLYKFLQATLTKAVECTIWLYFTHEFCLKCVCCDTAGLMVPGMTPEAEERSAYCILVSGCSYILGKPVSKTVTAQPAVSANLGQSPGMPGEQSHGKGVKGTLLATHKKWANVSTLYKKKPDLFL